MPSCRSNAKAFTLDTPMPALRIRSVLFSLMALIICLPVVALISAWLEWNASSAQVLRDMLDTVLPDYAITSLLLCMGVALGVTVLGTSTAAAVTLFRFPGQAFFEWALLLPMAIPAYVVAYAYTDFLQFSGPLQNFIRSQTGLEGRVLPEVRSLGGAILVFSLALYPYVYLLARTAFSERAPQLMEAARMLGAPLQRRILEVAIPLARPAVAAGVALALMETLADFGVSSYFGIQTFTAGIYKAWLVMDNRIAAAQLASVLLGTVLLLLQVEKMAQSRMRFASLRSGIASSADAQPTTLTRLSGLTMTTWCALPLILGFVLPVILMLRPLLSSEVEVPWGRFIDWAFNSLRLGAITAVLAVMVSLLLSFSLRRQEDVFTRTATSLIGLGYAVPGAVVVVGLLLPVTWLQLHWPETQLGFWLTATSLGLVWAYLVRFCAVALQSVQSGYARIPKSLDDSSRMLGISGLKLLTQVHAPLLKRSIFAATLLVFVDVMKELPATLVLRPFNTDTLAVMAYQLARDERLGEAALPSLALVCVGLLPVILLSRAMRKKPPTKA
ncbi:MAG: putative 2-aminoethylphosphonate transport system permease protein PhnU [Pseudomonadota bacterium]|jgi:iron(III) transport system permease protein